MKIVVKKVGQNPETKEIKGELNEMQEIVSGYIQAFKILDDVLCVYDDDGKLKNKTPNFIFNRDVIVGDVFFVAAGEEDFESLNDEQIDLIMTLLNLFELRKS